MDLVVKVLERNIKPFSKHSSLLYPFSDNVTIDCEPVIVLLCSFIRNRLLSDSQKLFRSAEVYQLNHDTSSTLSTIAFLPNPMRGPLNL